MSNPVTRNRRRAAGTVAAAGAAALFLGTIAPAGAAVQDVTYTLDSGSIRVGDNNYALPEATGITGTWDDDTGDFEGIFESAPVEENRDLNAEIAPGVFVPVSIFLTYEFVGDGPVTGNIDPVTGTGSATSNVDVVIKVIDVNIPPSPDRIPLGITCTIDDVNVNYDVAATDVVPESTLFNNLSLTAEGFNVPEPVCVVDEGGNPDFLDTVQGAIGDALGVPTDDTSAAIDLVLGEIPPPPTTTTRPPTTTTTADPGTGGTGGTPGATPARPVAAQPRFTG